MPSLLRNCPISGTRRGIRENPGCGGLRNAGARGPSMVDAKVKTILGLGLFELRIDRSSNCEPKPSGAPATEGRQAAGHFHKRPTPGRGGGSPAFLGFAAFPPSPFSSLEHRCRWFIAKAPMRPLLCSTGASSRFPLAPPAPANTPSCRSLRTSGSATAVP